MSAEGGSGLSPEIEELFEDSKPRRLEGLSGRELRAEVVIGLAYLATAVALVAYADSGPDFDVPLALVYVVAYAVASRIQFYVSEGYTVPTQLVFVPMLFAFPNGSVPLLVTAGILLGNLPDYVRRRTHPNRAVLAFGDSWHAIGPAAAFALGDVSGPQLGDWPIYAAALVSQFAFDFFFSSVRVLAGLGVRPTLQASVHYWVLLVDTALALIGFLAAYVSREESYAFLLALPLASLLGVFARERNTRIEHALELSRAYKGTALLLGDVVEADDEYTGAHSRGVLELAVAVGEAMRLPAYALRQVEFAALLHDVGKINIPKEIINKPGKLDDEEWAIMKTHTIEGQEILEKVGGVLGEVGRIVRSCHERYDGNGYPDGLQGREIPVAARIVFCCDAFNAMTTTRSYRKALPLDVALGELEDNAGTQFDPEVVGHIVRIIRADVGKFASESVERHGLPATAK